MRGLSTTACGKQRDDPAIAPPLSAAPAIIPPYGGSSVDLMSLVIVLIVIGVLLWLVNTYIPMDGQVKSILNAVVIIALVLWLLSLFVGPLPSIHVGK
jgi:hypothetical protein